MKRMFNKFTLPATYPNQIQILLSNYMDNGVTGNFDWSRVEIVH